MKIRIILALFLILGFASCKNESEVDTSNKINRDSAMTDLEKQKQTLEQKEKQLQDETERLKQQKAKNDSILKAAETTDLNGLWSGSLVDGSPFDLEISGFDGKTFKGNDQMFLQGEQDSRKVNITGTFDPKTREIVIDEDKKDKRSGKITGKLDANLKGMTGKWVQFDGKLSYTWELKRAAREKNQ